MKQVFLPFGALRHSLVSELQGLLLNRPTPIRKYDQIHMVLEHVATHAIKMFREMRGKKVLLMGDSDALCLAIMLLHQRFSATQQGPTNVTVLDFDKRVLAFYQNVAQAHRLEDFLLFTPYNVFDPVPENLRNSFDWFHTNPPFGQYNNGRSILAFVYRCISMAKKDAHGVVVLANDGKYSWTKEVLRAVLGNLLQQRITPSVVAREVHRYVLDDQPTLRSGYIICDLFSSDCSVHANSSLPLGYAEKFYGRETIPIPKYIAEEFDFGNDQKIPNLSGEQEYLNLI